MKSIPRVLWMATAILLIVATARLPYGYYTLLRIVTCGAAGVIAVVGFSERPPTQIWCIPFALISFVFNPIIPVYLNRSKWFYIDLATAALFVAHLIFVRQRFSDAPKPN